MAAMAGLLQLQLRPASIYHPRPRFQPLMRRLRRPRPSLPLPSSKLRIVALKPDIYKAMGMAVRTAKDILDAGTKLVPDSIPRPLAQAGVAVLGVLAFLYVVQSLFSLALFVLGIGSVGYYILFYLNKDNDEDGSGDGGGGGGGGSSGNLSDSSDTDLTLEEARRIMEKYK